MTLQRDDWDEDERRALAALCGQDGTIASRACEAAPRLQALNP